MLGTAFAIRTFKRFKVNYLFIFELDPYYKITHIQFLRVGVIFFFLLTLSFMLQLFIVKLDYIFTQSIAIFVLILIVIIFAICL